jgi:hypothetical protein
VALGREDRQGRFDDVLLLVRPTARLCPSRQPASVLEEVRGQRVGECCARNADEIPFPY